MSTDTVLQQIKKERERQDKIWGGPEHDNLHNNHDWAAYCEPALLDALESLKAKTEGK